VVRVNQHPIMFSSTVWKEEPKISSHPKAIELLAPNGTGTPAQQGIAGRLVEIAEATWGRAGID